MIVDQRPQSTESEDSANVIDYVLIAALMLLVAVIMIKGFPDLLSDMAIWFTRGF